MADVKEVGGVLMPGSEIHLEYMMRKGKRREVDGKLTYQYHKIEFAVAQVPVEKRMLAIDIGGHVGLWSMWLQKMFSKVVAFEPLEIHYDLFVRNVTMTNVTLHRVALGVEEKLIDIRVPTEMTGNAHTVNASPRHPGMKTYVPHPDEHTIVKGIEMHRLDEYDLQPDFIKIDVEGLERDVVAGGERTIKRAKPIMIVEQKGNESMYGHRHNAAFELLKSWGMKPIRNMSNDWIMGW